MYYEEKDNFKEAESKLTTLKGSQVRMLVNLEEIDSNLIKFILRLPFLKTVNVMELRIKTSMTGFTIRLCQFIKTPRSP